MLHPHRNFFIPSPLPMATGTKKGRCVSISPLSQIPISPHHSCTGCTFIRCPSCSITTVSFLFFFIMQNSFSSAKLRKISQNALFYQKLIFKTHYFTSFQTSKRTICTHFYSLSPYKDDERLPRLRKPLHHSALFIPSLILILPSIPLAEC